MINVAFILFDYSPSLGVGILAGLLRRAGHKTEIFFALDRDFSKKIDRFDPDLVGFSLSSGLVGKGLALASWSKARFPETKVVFGGPHPTFRTELVKEKNVDFLVRGEGEESILSLAEAIGDGRDTYEGLPNLVWMDAKGTIHEETLAAPVADLDSLPFPDWSCYFAKRWLAPYYRTGFTAMIGRGCTGNCSFCQSPLLRKSYPGRSLIRRRSVENVLDEIEKAKRDYKIVNVRYEDDDFVLDVDYLREFAEQSKKGKGVRFTCQTSARQVTDSVAAILESAGCYQVSIGLESGDPYIRRKLMNKPDKDSDILEASRLLKRRGIFVQTYNIFGFPGETVESALATWRLNREVRASFTWCSLFQAYPGTSIHQQLVAMGHIDEKEWRFPESYFVWNERDYPEYRQIVAVQQLTQMALWLRLPEKALRLLVRVGANPIYQFVFWLTFITNQVRTKKLSVIGTLIFSFYNRPGRRVAPVRKIT